MSADDPRRPSQDVPLHDPVPRDRPAGTGVRDHREDSQVIDPRDPTGGETAPDDQVAAPLERIPPITVAAFGDSVMWGQGVARDARFSVLTAKGIGALHNQAGVLAKDRSRSGAQMKVRDGSDREDFADTYPTLLPTDAAVDAFLQGDESAAEGLFGEVPCSFPTVRWQVESLPDDFGRNVDVALLCGGANDINFEAILDPRENQHRFVDRFAGDIREISHKDTLELLSEARRKMPNAVILLFGYFPPFSYATEREEIKKYFKHELDSDVQWWLNARADDLGISGGPFVDIDKMVVETRVRSVWAHGLATYWQRKAVTDANRDDAIRGPGVVFVPCGFRPRNSAFAHEPMVAGDYKHPASDPMQAERVRQTPRADVLPALKSALKNHILIWPRFTFHFHSLQQDILLPLREKIDGPRSLKEALLTLDDERVRGRTLRELLAGEIYRIQRAMIASFLHPNRQGNRRYADMAVSRYKAHRDAIDKLPDPLRPHHDFPGGPETLEDRLSRFGLRGPGPLRADVGHEFVDAIRVTVSTSPSSDKGFVPDLFLQLVLREVVGGHHLSVMPQLNMQYYENKKFHPQLEPNGTTDEFLIDISGHTRLAGQLPLKDLIAMELVVADMPNSQQTWLPEELSVDINGVEVLTRDLRGTRLGPGDSVDLDYPNPAPEVDTPVLASTMARRIGPVPR